MLFFICWHLIVLPSSIWYTYMFISINSYFTLLIITVLSFQVSLDMRLCACVLGVVMCVLSGLVTSEEHIGDHQQYRRGFRYGASDRFSHGFGKRSFNSMADQELEWVFRECCKIYVRPLIRLRRLTQCNVYQVC